MRCCWRPARISGSLAEGQRAQIIICVRERLGRAFNETFIIPSFFLSVLEVRCTYHTPKQASFICFCSFFPTKQEPKMKTLSFPWFLHRLHHFHLIVVLERLTQTTVCLYLGDTEKCLIQMIVYLVISVLPKEASLLFAFRPKTYFMQGCKCLTDALEVHGPVEYMYIRDKFRCL